MNIKIKAFANLRHFFPDKNEENEMNIGNGFTIIKLINFFDIPESEIMLFMVNGKVVKSDYVFCDNDIIEMFPILTGG